MLHQSPFLKDLEDCSLPLDNGELQVCIQECDFGDTDCHQDKMDPVDIIMEENNRKKTNDPYKRASFYFAMKDAVKQKL